MSLDNRSSTLLPSNTLANNNLSIYGTPLESPPSPAPSEPILLNATATTISVAFNVGLVTGYPAPTFQCNIQQIGGAYTVTNVATLYQQNFYTTIFSNLPTNANFRCIAIAINENGTANSNPSAIFSTGSVVPTAPNQAPTVPIIAPGTPPSTSLTATINTTGIFGTPTPTYSILYGTTTSPSLVAVPVLSSNNIYVANITGLTPSTGYYFVSQAINSVGIQVSAVSPVYTTSPTPGSPPSSAPTVPVVVGSPNANSITVSFDIAGITGTPTPTYSVLYGTSNPPQIPLTATLLSGTVYEATASGLLPNTTFYFRSVASNGTNVISASSAGITTGNAPVLPVLQTNVVIPFLLQGPRFGSIAPWAGIDYYINAAATGAYYLVGGSSTQGQQLFGNMYGGTVGSAGNLSGDPAAPVPYAGACVADQVFNFNFGSSSDAYLTNIQNALGTEGRVLACWGGYYADILGLFGPYLPTGYPGVAQPTAQQVVQSFLYNYCGITAGNSNPLNWRRQNTNNTSRYNFYFQGLVLDFENVGAGDPLNSYPYAPPVSVPQFPAQASNPIYSPYISALASIVTTYYGIAPTLFLGNAPVSLSIVGDKGTTNICASNTALNTWYPFPTATVAPTVATYNATASLALNHPVQLSYMDDIFVQFYNTEPDYYPGGQYFTNLLACWGYVALQAQLLGRKKTLINLGLAKGNIIPGGSPPYKANVQGPTPQLNGQTAPYTYWYPQYATSSPPNSTNASQNPDFWPNTGINQDPINVSNAILGANNILRLMTSNNALLPSDWLSGMGFWAAENATLMAQSVYNINNSLSPANHGGNIALPHTYTYCWGDASYPAPDPKWTGNVPIQCNYI